MRYVIVADPQGETVLCSGEDRYMEVLAQRIRQERLFRYVRLATELPPKLDAESACVTRPHASGPGYCEEQPKLSAAGLTFSGNVL